MQQENVLLGMQQEHYTGAQQGRPRPLMPSDKLDEMQRGVNYVHQGFTITGRVAVEAVAVGDLPLCCRMGQRQLQP